MTFGRNISVPTGCTLVFWGSSFDESAAIIFATTLRNAGICVKIVGINGLYATGQNGVTLQSDLAVSDIIAMVDQIHCIIIPCSVCSYQRLSGDPRLSKFFTEAAKRNAIFIVNTSFEFLQTFFPAADQEENVLTYPEQRHLLRFAGMLAHQLSSR